MPSAQTLTRSPASSLLLPLITLFAACEAEPADIELVRASLSQQVTPGVTFAEVVTNGSGCPAGTAETLISSDGLAFNTTFSTYLAQVGPSQIQTTLDCAFAIKLHSPAGRSYSVQTFAYNGYATLERGVVGRMTADYAFQGRPLAASNSNRTELTGPHDGSFVFHEDIDVHDRVWSPCGLERDLNVTTRIQVLNRQDLAGAGGMNISAADGSLRVVLQLAERACQTDDGGTPDGGSIDSGKADAGAPAPVAAPVDNVAVQPTQVLLQPSVIRRDQTFGIGWTARGAAPETSYVVQVRTPVESGRTLHWQSPPTRATTLQYAGPPFTVPGFHQVIVTAQYGTASASSEPLFLSVRADSFPSDPPALPPRDAAVADAVQDAGIAPPPDAGALPAAMPARGLYAARAYSFWSNGSGAMTTMKDISLAEILQTPTGPVLQMRLCAHRSSASGAVVDLVKPDAYPVIRRALSASSNGWGTDAEPVAVGFDRAGVAQCKGHEGEYLSRRNAQVWLRDSCRCPNAAEDVPTAEDCRVTDPDNDRQPGLAHRQSGRYGVTLHLASVNRVQLLRGRVEADGSLSASLRADESRFQLACAPSGCSNMVEQMRPCTSEQNGAQLVPLPPTVSWDCATVLANEQQLFPRALPAAPRICQSDALTDPY